MLAISRIMVAWQPVGACMGVYDMAARYIQERQQFGAPLAAFQLVQERMTRMLGTVQVGKHVAWFLCVHAWYARPYVAAGAGAHGAHAGHGVGGQACVPAASRVCEVRVAVCACMGRISFQHAALLIPTVSYICFHQLNKPCMQSANFATVRICCHCHHTTQAMFLMAHRLTRLYEEGRVTHEQASLVKAWNTARAREVCLQQQAKMWAPAIGLAPSSLRHAPLTATVYHAYPDVRVGVLAGSRGARWKRHRYRLHSSKGVWCIYGRCHK